MTNLKGGADRNASGPNGTPMKKAAIFLDRDGVINEYRPDYAKSWEEFKFLPGTLQALRALAATSHPIVIVSNQSAISRGLITREAVDEIHFRMLKVIHGAGGRVDAVYYCPHGPDDGCSCRKPRPGLLIQAAEELNLNLPASWFIGDNVTDLQAALAVGAQPVLVRTGHSNAITSESISYEIMVFQDLANVVKKRFNHTDKVTKQVRMNKRQRQIRIVR